MGKIIDRLEARENVRRISLEMRDGEPEVKRGNYLMAIGTRGKANSCYQVLIVHAVNRQSPGPVRYRLVIKKVETVPAAGIVFYFHWNPRKKKTCSFTG